MKSVFSPLLLSLGIVHLPYPATSGVEMSSQPPFDAVIHPLCARQKCRAVLAVLAGANGDSAEYFKDVGWVAFARTNSLALVAVTFRSPVAELKTGRGYYNSRLGSGKRLLAYLDANGLGGLPLFLYGFSGGAHFTASFAEGFPNRVTAWCAASAGWWENVREDVGRSVPGIVACGTEDPRYGACLAHFHDARAARRRLTWVEVPAIGHERNKKLEDFARMYFLAILNSRLCKTDGAWVDIATGEPVVGDERSTTVNSSWLPHAALADAWRALTGRDKMRIIKRTIKSKANEQPVLTVFLRETKSVPTNGVLCLCLLANRPDEIPYKIMTGNDSTEISRMVAFAESNSLAVVAWGSARDLWNPRKNWDELPHVEMWASANKFEQVANAWEKCISKFEMEGRIPKGKFLIWGYSGAAQYAQRLVLRRPERFLAVHIHIPSSFDVPAPAGRSVLWCLTTGENEAGYERSLSFFMSARKIGYPIIYRAYPGLGHSGCAAAAALGAETFRFALQNVHQVAKSGWQGLFDAAPKIGDVVNQRCDDRKHEADIPQNYRVVLPSNLIAERWSKE